MIANWGEEGEIDLLEFFGELTLYTSSSCLIGRKFRGEAVQADLGDLSRSRTRHRPVRLRRLLRRHRKFPPPRHRPRRTRRIHGGRGARRVRGKPEPDKEKRDLLDVLVSLKNADGTPMFSADTVTACSSP